MRFAFEKIAENTKKLKNIRAIGGVVAADLICPENSRTGYKIYKVAVKKGALLRPLGNTIYWFPPLNIDDKDLAQLKHITRDAILEILG